MPTETQALLPLMLVPLMVWLVVWGYLWNLDSKINRLKDEMRRLEEGESEEL